MRRLLLLIILVLCAPLVARANEAARGWCETGGQKVLTSGLQSTNLVQQSNPQCTVTVFNHGTGTLATIYQDNNVPPTPLSNPFYAGTIPNTTGGQWIFYAADGRYDVTTSLAGMPGPVSYFDVLLCDPFGGGVCAGGGGGIIESFQHNGVLVGQQPIFNFIDSGTITGTMTNDPANNRVNLTLSGGGGTGCTLPGHNTAVLSEHPAGTCYDSLDFTWDDGTFTHNLQVGDGTNVLSPGNSDQVVLGPGNTTTSSTSPSTSISELSIIGDHNFASDSTNGGEFYIIGNNNSATRVNGSYWSMGNNNFSTDVNQNIFSIGANQTVQSATSGTAANIGDCFLFGEGSLLKQTPSLGVMESCMVLGFGNQLIGQAGMDGIGILGEQNSLTTVVNGISTAHILGSFNTIEDTLNLTNQAEIVGENNDVNGSLSTIQILGYRNAAHNVSAQGISTVNTTMVGSANAATNTGGTGSPAYQELFGHLTNLHDCFDCIAIGANVAVSTNHTMGIGMSASPEIVIGIGNVQMSGTTALSGHLNQGVTKQFAGTCSMAATTVCTFTLTGAFSTTPVCVVSPVTTVSGNVVAGACSVSSTTVTITAAASNSLAWNAVIVGNPN